MLFGPLTGCACAHITRRFQLQASLIALISFVSTSFDLALAQPQRVLGADISYWNCGTSSNGMSQANWNSACTNGSRLFVFLRATRGGTTGQDQPQGTPAGGSIATLSHRYDDPRFVQNLIRATAAGMVLGPYHFARPDVAGNTGTDEADHFMQMAGPWMRPGYLMPVFDQEAGSGSDTLVKFANDFSDEIYAAMQIRPCIYINGNYSSIFQGATLANRDKLAKPASLLPSVSAADYPMLWDAYYTTTLDRATANPKDGYSGFYGPWDDYGTAHPWSFWQHSSSESIAGFNALDASCDSDVSHGDLEYVRNYLVPAVWWNDSSGDWSTLANWNCGQTPVAPVTPPDQAPPYSTGGLPTPRAPGAAGSGPTSGQYDTVVLERPTANFTVTVSTGSYNIRKLYLRETLNITGGSLTINYDPAYRPDDSTAVLHAGPISAQFSGPVTLSGSGNLTVNTLQVDTNRVFTLTGGTLTFKTINLMPHSSAPAKILASGDVAFNALANGTGTIAKGSGSGSSGLVDLGGGTRSLNIGNGTSDVDVSLDLPITNGGITKNGSGTLRFSSANSYGGGTIISAGRLLVNNTTNSGTGAGTVIVNGGVLAGMGTIAGAVTVNSGGTIAPGLTAALGTLTLNSSPTFAGTNFMRIDRNGGSPLADKIALTSGPLNYGGTLVVSNVGASLTGGEVFASFSASTFSGAFARTNLPPLGSGLNWYLGNLATNGTIAVNRKPVAGGATFTQTPGQIVQIPISTLVASATDPDGDALALAAFDPVTTNGIPLSADSFYLYYSNSVNVMDRFSYTISDGRGGSAIGAVLITNAPSIPPSITAGPTNLNILAGQTATFTVSATGTPALRYEWRFNNTPIPGATNTVYTRVNAQTNDGGSYSVVVTNSAGSASSNALLTVAQPLAWQFQSANLLPDGRLRMLISGQAGASAWLERSSNFVNWDALTNFLNASGTYEHVDSTMTNLSSALYRVRQ
jgi:autotransporter-associated beta strand protein